MWADLAAWAQRHMVRTEAQMLGPSDMSISECVDDFDAAIALLREAHTKWKGVF